jgi:2-polyprenyl-3-methyl-5-hydroxy-6-metoxy-1,4-benzoquinol methylase
MIKKVCILCNNQKLELISSRVRDSKKYKVVKCIKCKHVQLFPIPTKQDDRDFYDKELQNKAIKQNFKMNELREMSANDVERRAMLIKKLLPKSKKILEIGSGDGFFLEKMKSFGYEMTGIEISSQRRYRSRKITKIKILNIDFSEEIPNIGKYDAIVLFHVLEHLHNPIIFLKNIVKLLKPKGKIVVEVPNFNDYQNKININYKNWQLQRAHIHYFSPKILKNVFTLANLTVKIIGIQRYSIENMFFWKIHNTPQITNPKFNLENDYTWIEKHYKKYLEKKLLSDTIIAIGNLK